ncbi:MAG: OadG family protein [Prevotella sp.]|nr:OadG family protein [Candidatus Prevotella equi]
MNIGITLMIVGMVTVFAVLLIIINLSKLLINIVNKVAPEEATKPKAAPAPAIPQDIMEVIRQSVSQITGGKGTVANVVKI